MNKRLGKQTLLLESRPAILAHAAVAGKKEGSGPLKNCFDYISDDSYFGEQTWEKAESHMLRQCFSTVCDKAQLAPSALGCVLSGDLLNQCVSSAFAMRRSGVPYLGLYGACSTMAESLALASILVDGGYASTACALTGSHFCSAERQYRFPLEYGGQRPPTAQWTVTGAGAVIVGQADAPLHITHVTLGRIVDTGITDANAMGSAMAPAALDTLRSHFVDTGLRPEDYDAVFTGDLGALGRDLLQDMLEAEGLPVGPRYMDCGVLIYDLNAQEVNAGGSGCGCSACVLGGHILGAMERGVWRRVLFAATGALLSATSAQQGEAIPGICHAVAIEREG